MKNHKSHRAIWIFLLAAFLINGSVYSQEFDIKKFRTIFKFSTVKQADNTRLLHVSFIAQNKKNRKEKIPIYEAEIEFLNELNDSTIVLGKAKTNNKGIAQFIVPKDQTYLVDEEGYINLKANFKGTKSVKRARKSVAVKDIQLELNLIEIDSIKTVQVNAFTLDSLGTKQPIEEADIVVSVKGMISNMPIEEGTIEDGTLEFEFPTDIPGDANGNISVVAFIEDHDDFGNVIQEKNVNWGVFHKQVINQKNTLWSEGAPLWMYIVLSILLIGVWANYIYTIKNLFKIKKEGSN